MSSRRKEIDTAATLVRDRPTWLFYGQFAVWGYFGYGFGPAVPMIRDEFHLNRAAAGLHGSAMAIGTLASGAALPYLVRRLGRGRTLWLAFAGIAVSVIVLSLAPNLAGTLSGAALAALAGSTLSGCVIAFLADHHGKAGPAAISEAMAANVGMGLLAPLMLAAVGWRAGLGVTAALVVVVAVLAKAGGGARTPATSVTSQGARAHGRLPKQYWLAWSVIVLCISTEVCLSLWMSDELRVQTGMSASSAAAAASALFGGILVGRLIGGQMAGRYGRRRLLLAVMAVAAVGFVVFWAPSVSWLAVSGLGITGLGIALQYPLAVDLAVEASAGRPDLAAARTQYAFGLSFGVAPLALGVIAEKIGMHHAFLLVPTLLAAAASGVVLLGTTGRTTALGAPGHTREADTAASPSPSSARRSSVIREAAGTDVQSDEAH
ncbi:MFS transporter [Streptomyces sp. NPDC002676]